MNLSRLACTFYKVTESKASAQCNKCGHVLLSAGRGGREEGREVDRQAEREEGRQGGRQAGKGLDRQTERARARTHTHLQDSLLNRDVSLDAWNARGRR